MIKEYLFNQQNLPIIFSPALLKNATSNKLYEWIQKSKGYIFNKLYSHGSILFRDFTLRDVHDFQKCLDAFGLDFCDYKGGDSPRDKVSRSLYTSTSYPSSYDISMHNEKSFSNDWPTLIFFFCDEEPLTGGETPLLDGRKLYSSLDKSILNRFSTKKLKYVMNLHNGDGIGKSWKECFETTDKRSIEKFLTSIGASFLWKDDESLRIEEIVNPVIYHPVTKDVVFFSQADQWHYSNLDIKTYQSMLTIMSPEDFYHNCYYADNTSLNIDDLNHIRNIQTTESISFPWKKGDLLMVDNILTLHGRKAFTGNRRILVSLSKYIYYS